MKIKIFKFIVFISFIFFLSPLYVEAAFGDVRYDITKVSLNGSQITFKGWAFIHKTNNYDKVELAGLDNGDQKILIRAVKNNGVVIDTKVVKGNNNVNYNFYCELFAVAPGKECENTNYSNPNFNKCDEGEYNYCYYEDMYFSISFDTSSPAWSSITAHDTIRFEIAVSNADFESERSNASGVIEFDHDNDGVKDYFTRPIDVYVSSASVGNTSNDFIEIDNSTLSTEVKFIATHGYLYKADSINELFTYGKSGCAYGEYRNNYKKTYFLVNLANYPNGRGEAATDRCNGKPFLGNYCKGSHYYALSVSNDGAIDIADLKTSHCQNVATPGEDSVAIARGSHLQLTGSSSFRINILKNNLCPVVTPSSGSLQCNNSNTFTSNCDKLTVITSEGRAEVKIEQNGTISSVLSPTKTYAGGGFNFGVMYYNTIKWDYVGTTETGALHTAVKGEMEKKIKDYNTYIAGIKISNLKLNGQIPTEFSSLNKECTASTEGKDYYQNGITVSCVFTFPEPKLHYNGTVTYANGGNININNKYYTPIKYSGDYELTANIVGMDRITDSAAKNDSKEEGKAWTGTWTDDFKDCKVSLYPLLIKDGKNNFIYRPIDLNNPFPNNRRPGINWYDWISVSSNIERLKNTYSDSNNKEYEAKLDNNAINNIKNYNKNHNYLDWSNIGTDEKSSFITDNNYINRTGGSR